MAWLRMRLAFYLQTPIMAITPCTRLLVVFNEYTWSTRFPELYM